MKKFVFIYFGLLVFVLSLFVSGLVESQDGLQYLAVARNIYYTGKPTAPIYEYGKENDWKNVHLNTHIGRDGNTYGLTGLGFSLVMLPAVAITDIFYQIYDITPSVHFPLENDWLIFLTTSFVNVFFAALLGVVIYLYLKEIGLKHKSALLISLLSVFTTNLFAFSKHITAHMMFTSFLFTSFFLLKKYFTSSKKVFLLLSGVVYGIVSITYNSTFLLSVLPFVSYYVLLKKPKLNKNSYKQIARDLLTFLVGIFPFIITYFWFENLRTPGNSAVTFVVNFAKNRLSNIPATVFFEGMWGQLFSPGRSIFIYSPLLLVIVFFWFKIKKKVSAEAISFGLLFIIYIVFYASIYMVGGPKQGIAGLWHGESSWGPRYLAPLIPFGMVIVGHIFQQISKRQKLFVFIPLSLVGLYVAILGITMPYQIKYHYLEDTFFVNNNEYNKYAYINLLPRYSPIIMQSKNLYRLVTSYKNKIIPGAHNVKMYDGINFAFNVGPERWRSIEKTGYVSFDDSKKQLKEISLDIINHPISDTKNDLLLDFEINGQKAITKPVKLSLGERKLIYLDLSKVKLKEKDNLLIIKADFGDDIIIKKNRQIAGLIDMKINNRIINKEYISVPYVSEFGPKMLGIKYSNWGGTNKDPWRMWDLHSQTFERLPDFWWLRNMHYWDVPKSPLILLLVLNLSGILYFGPKVIKTLK